MISIIIPIYNRELFLEKCLNSVQRQTFVDFECILVDNNSTDHSVEICQLFLSDDRFKLIHCQEQGVSHARNKGIEYASGDWIMFIDSDDYIADNFVEMLYKTMLDHPWYKCYTCESITLQHTNISIWNDLPEGERTKDDVANFNIWKRWATVWNALWAKEVFDHIKFNTNVKLGEDELVDIEYWMRYGKLYHIKYRGYFHYVNTSSISVDQDNYKHSTMLLLCLVENLIHKYDNLTKEVENAIRYIYNVKYSDKYPGIDYVVPYTNATKDKIKALMQFYNYEGMVDDDEELAKRYNTEDTIFNMSIRSVARNLPFIRLIHLIVEDETHIPDWIDIEKVHIVYHKDFMEDYPSYNPCCIEYCLGNIPFLSEKFLYANSDYIATKELSADDFFDEDKTRNRFRTATQSDKQCDIIFNNSYSLIFNEGTPLSPIKHFFTPMVTKRVKEVQELYKDKLVYTKFRSSANYNQYIYPLYDLKIGAISESTLICYTTEGEFDIQKWQRADVVCLENIDDTNPLITVFGHFFHFEKCKYEK